MNVNANWGPLLLMIFFGMLCIFHMLSWYILATSLKEIEVVVAMSLIILENQSTTTKIASLSSDLGRGPMMSMLIPSHGVFGVGKECKGAAFFMCCTLFCWHSWHPWTYFCTSLHIPGHQCFFLLIPSFYVVLDYLVSKLFVSWDIDLAIYVDNSVFFLWLSVIFLQLFHYFLFSCLDFLDLFLYSFFHYL